MPKIIENLENKLILEAIKQIQEQVRKERNQQHIQNRSYPQLSFSQQIDGNDQAADQQSPRTEADAQLILHTQ